MALQCVDHKKLLYGSDYPLLIYPGRQSEPDFCPFIEEIEAVGLSPGITEDVMGNNAARLLGLMEAEGEARVKQIAKKKGALQGPVITQVADAASTEIDQFMAVSMVARVWPQTQAVFDEHGIPWKDNPVPFWEPIAQAAAAHGYGPAAREQLLRELNEATSD
jgi:hypothetical protein